MKQGVVESRESEGQEYDKDEQDKYKSSEGQHTIVK
jgi:hypothetical protein